MKDAASPIGDLFDQHIFSISRSDEQPNPSRSTSRDTSRGELGVRETARQQWETLRPVIEKIYIQENKSFPYLARILRNEHGFEPTKRQFARQIEKWGFKKNIPRTERRQILQNLTGGVKDPFITCQDPRLNEGKLKNWQSRYREELNASRRDPIYGGDQVLHKNSANNGVYEQLPSEPPGLNTLGQPFQGDWSTVNIPDSPELSGLFNALEIESETYVPPLYLNTSNPEESLCLSSWEIERMSLRSAESENDMAHQRKHRPHMHPASTESCSKSGPRSPMRYGIDVFCGYITSPFTEIYVFPSPTTSKTSNKPGDPGTQLWTRLQTREIELEASFAKLKKHFPADNHAIMAVMEDLATTFNGLTKHSKAESIRRDLHEVYRRTLGADHLKTLEAQQKVIESVISQGCIDRAMELTNKLRLMVSKLLLPHHPLAIRAAKIDARLAHAQGRYEDSERFRRNILQVKLTSHGPRHHDGMRALSLLGNAMSKVGKRDGETLLRSALQLSLECPDEYNGDRTTCWAMVDLASALDANGEYEESYNVATNARGRYHSWLGPRDKRIISLVEQQAWSALNMCSLTNSEKLFRHLVSLYNSDTSETNVRGLANACFGLAVVLSKMGHIEDGIGWYKKSFDIWSSRKERNPSAPYPSSLFTCHSQAGRFVAPSRFSDTLEEYIIDESHAQSETGNTIMLG